MILKTKLSLKGDKYMSEFRKKVKELNDDYEFKQFLTQEEDEKKRISTFEAIAREEGKVIGREEGKTIGIKEANIKIAKNLLNMNMSLENISKVTGLKINEIKAINTEK